MKEELVILEDKIINPYENFDYTKYSFDVVPFWDKFWGKTPTNDFSDCHPIFEKLISEIRPSLILEVGSYKGKSAIHMANLTKKYQLSAKVICIDTWLGSAEHYHSNEDLKRANGYPTLYYQFLANVMHTNNQDIIHPIALDSLSEYRILKENGTKAEMIYIDAGHFYESVSLDIKLYWELLRPGGVMLGDDYGDFWSDVVKAVHEFFPQDQIHIDSNKWWVYKPLENTFNKSW
jgi:hypothetical protein